jgi:AcrR family transcriptional regulator
MDTRAEAAQRTREAVLDAAVTEFDDRWYDEVTLADVARTARVSQQTVVNHFGSKENLYLTGIAERFAPRVQEIRARLRPGDVRSLAEVAVADYEQTGIGTLRVIALADRQPALAQLVAGGRRAHREWVASGLAPLIADRPETERSRLIRLAAVAVDVRTWQQLRVERSAPDVVEDMEALLNGLLAR